MELLNSEKIQAIQDLVIQKILEESQKFEVEREAPPADQLFSSEEILKALSSGQDGDAWLHKNLMRGCLAYDHASGSWYLWEGHHWAEDRLQQSLASLDPVIEVYSGEASRQSWLRLKAAKANNTDAESQAKARENALLGRIQYLQTLHYKRAVLVLSAAGNDSLGITGDEWDKDPWLLGVKNGVIELKTGDFRPGRQEDFIKTFAPTEWHGLDASAPTWDEFISAIFDNDKTLTAFVRRLFGYSITGLTSEHILAILWGTRGRNGKGTKLETLNDVLGPLAGPVQAEMLLDQSRLRSSAGPASDIMALRGRRLAWASETGEGRRLDAGKIKWLTGGDSLVGRQPYGKHEVSFRPTHTLFLLTNYRPRADANDHALFQRILLIPYVLRFVDNPTEPCDRKRDPHLLEKLIAEAPGILAWLVRGCLEWQREGLNPPPSVRLATDQYQENEDLIRHFLQECCILKEGAKVQAGKLYKAYCGWCDTNGHRPLSATRFGDRMKNNFDFRKTNYVEYFGIGLLKTLDTLDT